MQKCTRETNFIIDDRKEIVGVNLGWDFVTEHEMGIDGIIRDFGLGLEGLIGFEARKNTKVPQNLIFINKEYGALFSGYYVDQECALSLLNRDLKLRPYRPESSRDSSFDDKSSDIVGAWDWDSFCVTVSSRYKTILKDIYDAMLNKNAIIMLGGKSGLFSNRGLLLADYAKISQEDRDSFAEKDRKYIEEQAKFRRLEKESGIYELLKKAGKIFHYLRVEEVDDKGNPVWFLNPMEQRLYNGGRCTTEILRQWAEDKGPIVKTEK